MPWPIRRTEVVAFSEKLKDPEDPEGNPEKKKEREEKGGKGECVKGKGKRE